MPFKFKGSLLCTKSSTRETGSQILNITCFCFCHWNHAVAVHKMTMIVIVMLMVTSFT